MAKHHSTMSQIESYLTEIKFKKQAANRYRKVINSETEHFIIFSKYKWNGVDIIEPAFAVRVPALEKRFFAYAPKIARPFFVTLTSLIELASKKGINRSPLYYALSNSDGLADRVITDVASLLDDFFSYQLHFVGILEYLQANNQAGGTAREASMAYLAKATGNHELFQEIVSRPSFAKLNILEQSILID